jgi:rubrerythrin
MGVTFNADEVLKMAERIEADGAEFYRRAAKLHAKSGGNTGFLLRLADMEDEHRRTFAAMRAALPPRLREETAFDPYLEATLYLQGLADAHGGEGAPSAARALTGKETMADILRTAIGLEEKSIVFYLGLKDMVPPEMGRDRVEAIVAEEKSHIVTLAAELRKVGKGGKE